MSQFQIWLAIAGGLVLVVMVAHSTWTSRKNQPKQAEPLITPEERLALEIEPTLSEVTDPDTLSGEWTQSSPVHERPTTAQLDALIDVIATIELDAPVSGEAAIAALPPIRRIGTELMRHVASCCRDWSTIHGDF